MVMDLQLTLFNNLVFFTSSKYLRTAGTLKSFCCKSISSTIRQVGLLNKLVHELVLNNCTLVILTAKIGS